MHSHLLLINATVQQVAARLAVLAMCLAASGAACGGGAASTPGVSSDLCDNGFCRAGTTASAARAGAPDPALPEPALPGAEEACVGSTCSQCPSPLFDVMSSSPPQWARHPETGICCEYANMIAVTPGWPVFDTRSECETDCRCAVLEDYFEGEGYSIDRMTLECRCAGGECPSTPEAAAESLCRSGGSAYRREGCGLIAMAHDEPTYGEGWVFTDGVGSSVSLVGAYSYTDARAYPCQTYSSIAGRELECEEAVECQLCGEASDASRPTCD